MPPPHLTHARAVVLLELRDRPRKETIGRPLTQLVAQPLVERGGVPDLVGAPLDASGQQAVRRPPENVLLPSGADEHVVGKASRVVDEVVIEEWEARLATERHGVAICVAEKN